MSQKLRVTVWNEFRHEKENEVVRAAYPDGIHTAIGEGLSGAVDVTYATLDDAEHGLSEEVLNNTDVLIW